MTGDNSKMFDRPLTRQRRERAAAQWGEYNFLKREGAVRIGERLEEFLRGFPVALDLGCHHGEVAEEIKGKGGIETLFQCDLSHAMAKQARGLRAVCDEEFLPFAPNSFDLVISDLSLHHVNDLPGALIQIRHALKPDGLFLGVLPGANSLAELRESITGAAVEHGFGLSPRLSPLIEVRDAGALLQRAGFAMPVADAETVTVEYDHAWKLMQDLRGMGESNVLLARDKRFTPRSHLAAITHYYQTHFARPEGTVPATFEFVTMTGWKV